MSCRVPSSPSSRRRRIYCDAPAFGGAAVVTLASPPADSEWEAMCEAVIDKLHALASSKEKRKEGAEFMLALADRLWDVALDMKARKAERYSAQLLREVMSLMEAKDLKEVQVLFKLARVAMFLLQMEGATRGVPGSGVQAAYMFIAKVLFKFSQREGHDHAFLQECLLEPLLAVLESDKPECSASDLRVYIVGILKNVSHEEGNQRHLAQKGVVAVLFGLVDLEKLKGSSKESQILIQITATLRNFAGPQYRQFLQAERLSCLTGLMSLFAGHTELLTNIARIFSKLTTHNSACEALAKTDLHVRQLARSLSAVAESGPLTLRLTFVLGNLTERCERLRIVFAFDCEGTTLVPQLLSKWWQRARKLSLQEHEPGKAHGSKMKEAEEILVKLVRLLANIAISPSAGSTLASCSAVTDPLLDMLGSKRIGDSEELVLNVVAAVTNLLFYDVPSNLLFSEDSKQLLCRLFRPLLLESYNVEALIETTRALGNLSRHMDARKCMAALRLDEILVILLDHEDRDLVFYCCGTLVNLAADPECSVRLLDTCPAVEKLGTLMGDVGPDDVALHLVAVKVLTNLSLDPAASWPTAAVKAVQGSLEKLLEHFVEPASKVGEESQQLVELSQQLLDRIPA